MARLIKALVRVNKSIRKNGHPKSGLKVSKATLYLCFCNMMRVPAFYIELDYFSADTVYDCFATIVDLKFVDCVFLNKWDPYQALQIFSIRTEFKQNTTSSQSSKLGNFNMLNL